MEKHIDKITNQDGMGLGCFFRFIALALLVFAVLLAIALWLRG